MIYPKIPVLLYHSIEKDYFQDRIDVLDFEKQMFYLKIRNIFLFLQMRLIKNKNQIILTLMMDTKTLLQMYCLYLKNIILKQYVYSFKSYRQKQYMGSKSKKLSKKS